MPPQGGLVLGLAPQKAKDAALNSLLVTVNTQRVDITDRNVVIASVPRSQVVSADCQRIEISSTESGTFAGFIGLPPSADYAELDAEQKRSPRRPDMTTCGPDSPIPTSARTSSGCSPTSPVRRRQA